MDTAAASLPVGNFCATRGSNGALAGNGVAGKSVGASEAETGEWADGFVGYNAAITSTALRSRVVALMRRQIGFAAHVERFD